MNRTAIRLAGIARFGHKSLAGTVLSGLLAAAFLVFGLTELPRQQHEASRWVNHTLEVLARTATLEADLATASSEGRGFMLDHSDETAVRLETAVAQVESDLKILRTLTRDNPVQQQALDRLEPMIAARVAFLRETIEYFRVDGDNAALAAGRTLRGRALADQIHTALGQIKAEEHRLLKMRNLVSQRAAWRTLAGVLGCGVLALAGGLLAAAMLISRKRQREHLNQVRRIKAGLGDIVRERTAELAASEAKLRTYFRYLADGIVVLRAQPDGSFTYDELNASAERLLGRTMGQVRGKRPAEVWPKAHANFVEARLRECAASGKPLSYREFPPAAGERRRLFAVLTPVHDEAGELKEIIKSLRDVTDYARMEARLRESEAHHRLLTEHASDMVSRVGPDGERLYVSPAAERVVGVPASELLGRGLLARTVPEDRPILEAFIRRMLSGEVEQDIMTYRMLHPERGEIWIEGHARVLRDPQTGALEGYIAISRDVTERHRYEAERQAQADALRAANAELERSNAELERLARHLAEAKQRADQASLAKSRFLAGMSHELRTPLNGILGYAQLLRLEGGLTAAQAARVDSMLAAGSHLLDMINRVLELSEIENDRIELRAAQLDPADIARGCLELVRPKAEAKGLALHLYTAPDAPKRLDTDPTRLRQVLLNLLGNAVKFTERGAVEVRLGLAAENMDLRIAVVDTGPGIVPARRHRLFQDFERLGDNAALVEGAGLGLALSARLAAMMGGRLGHEDNPGGGSIFWLELPVAGQAPAKPAPAEVLHPGDGESPAAPAHVLLVDDVAMNRDVAGAFLRAAGHAVVCAESGAEAVALAAERDFDVILMDVRMPEMDGLEATRRIRALPRERGRVPVVALTAQAFAEQVSECRRVGMDYHVSKPFAPDVLIATVARAVASGRAHGGPQLARPGETLRPSRPAACPAIPVLDEEGFARTAAFFAPEALSAHLATLADRGEALLEALRQPDPFEPTGKLAAAAHTLAGSAGMFGFARLADAGRRFERSVRSGAAETDSLTLAGELVAALEASLSTMRPHPRPVREEGGAGGHKFTQYRLPPGEPRPAGARKVPAVAPEAH